MWIHFNQEIDYGWFTLARYEATTIANSLKAGDESTNKSISFTNIVRLGETIPIRLFLGGFDLTPTFREVNKKYSTRYYLSLVLIDEGKQATMNCILLRSYKILRIISCSLLHYLGP